MNDVLLYVLIGLTAGLLSGFLGVAGGIVIVPALLIFGGFSQLTAQGTSLAILLPPVGLLAFIEYYKNDHVDVKAAVIICAMLFIGALVGAKIAHAAPPAILRKGFAVLLLMVSLKLLIGK